MRPDRHGITWPARNFCHRTWERDRQGADAQQHPGARRSPAKARDNNVEQALRALKKKLQREGVFSEMKRAAFYEKLSEKAAREQSHATFRNRFPAASASASTSVADASSRPVRQPIAKAFVPPCRRGGLLANDSYAVVALASSHFAMLVAASP
jgi:small subunit ribosomal protein S21